MSQQIKVLQNNSTNATQYYQQQQVQQYIEQEKQEQAQIQYYIYQDLQNIINLIYSRKAVIEYFKDDPSHEMVTLSNNKLILQLNLSSSIHLDQFKQYERHPNLLNFLKEERKKAFKILEKYIDNNDEKINSNGKQMNNGKILNQLQQYKQNYANQQFDLTQFELQQTKLVSNFDEGVLSKVISSIQTVDSQVGQIRNTNEYQIPNQYEIDQKAKNYYNMTQGKLNENFSKDKPNSNQLIIENQKNFNPINNELYNNAISQKQELINFLLFSGFFNDQEFQCNSYNLLQEWINQIKDDLITQTQLAWVKEFYWYKDKFEYHCKLYYFFQLFFEYKQLSSRCYENQQIQVFKNCLMNNKQYLKQKIYKFYEQLKMNNQYILMNCQQQSISNQEQDYIYYLYQKFCEKCN